MKQIITFLLLIFLAMFSTNDFGQNKSEDQTLIKKEMQEDFEWYKNYLQNAFYPKDKAMKLTLKDFINMEVIKLDISTYPLYDKDLIHLRHLKNLISVSIKNDDEFGNKIKINGSGLKYLESSKSNLRSIYIGDPIKSENLKYVGKLVNLDFLSLEINNWDDEDLKYLKNLMKLRTLILVDGKLLSANGFKYLKYLKNIENLRLSNISSDVDLSFIENMVKIKKLKLSQSKIDDFDISYLRKLEKLEELDLELTNITSKGMKYFLNLSKIEKLNLSSTLIDDKGLKYLKNMKNLVELNIGNRPKNTYSFEERNKILEENKCSIYTNFSSLIVIKYMNLTGTGFEDLRELKNLKYLNAEFTYWNDEGIKSLRHCTGLESINLNFTNVSGKTISYLKNCNHLYGISLESTKVNDKSLIHFKKLNNLQGLNLSNNNIKGSGLIHLKGLKNLEKLNLIGTKLTDETAKVLLEFPKLNLSIYDLPNTVSDKFIESIDRNKDN